MEMSEVIWQVLSLFGDWVFWLPFSAGFLIFYSTAEGKVRKRMDWIAFVLIPSVAISSLLSLIIKYMLQVPRICNGMPFCPIDYSLPSMHSSTIFAFCSAVYLCKQEPQYYLPSLAISFFVAYSRIALGVHTFLDVITGAIIGISVSAAWFLFCRSNLKCAKSLCW